LSVVHYLRKIWDEEEKGDSINDSWWVEPLNRKLERENYLQKWQVEETK